MYFGVIEKKYFSHIALTVNNVKKKINTPRIKQRTRREIRRLVQVQPVYEIYSTS